MARRLAVVMDPIAGIKPAKDTSLALLLAAQARGWELLYLEMQDLWLRDGVAWGRARELQVFDDAGHWHQLGEPQTLALGEVDAILMRKDPPFDSEYVYATYILERAEAAGALVCNRPQALRDANEKAYTAWFADCAPPTLIARHADQLRAFRAEHGDIIAKPLDGMGGASIFRIRDGDPNASVIFETLTAHGRRYCMLQKFIPAISEGDKRVLVVDGKPMPFTLARIPPAGETRGNLAAGGSGVVMPITEREQQIAEQLGPTLRDKGLLFVGLDVIGGYLTEINVTSPTCVREIEREQDIDIAGQLIDAIAARLP